MKKNKLIRTYIRFYSELWDKLEKEMQSLEKIYYKLYPEYSGIAYYCSIPLIISGDLIDE